MATTSPQDQQSFRHGLRAPTHTEGVWLDQVLLDDSFREIERFLDIFEKARDREASEKVEAGQKLSSQAWEFGADPVGDELFILGNCWRISCAAALLRTYAITEATLRGAYFKVVDEVERRRTVTPERAMRWKKSFGRHGGLPEMVDELRLFVNDVGIRVVASTLTGWKDIDDMRLLCNAFKHRSGVIEWDSVSNLSDIDKRLLELLKQKVESKSSGHYVIEYESLDIRGYVGSANRFCGELLRALCKLLDGSEIRA